MEAKTDISKFFDNFQFAGVSQWRYDLCAEDWSLTKHRFYLDTFSRFPEIVYTPQVETAWVPSFAHIWALEAMLL